MRRSFAGPRWRRSGASSPATMVSAAATTVDRSRWRRSGRWWSPTASMTFPGRPQSVSCARATVAWSFTELRALGPELLADVRPTGVRCSVRIRRRVPEQDLTHIVEETGGEGLTLGQADRAGQEPCRACRLDGMRTDVRQPGRALEQPGRSGDGDRLHDVHTDQRDRGAQVVDPSGSAERRRVGHGQDRSGQPRIGAHHLRHRVRRRQWVVDRSEEHRHGGGRHGYFGTAHVGAPGLMATRGRRPLSG